MKPLIARCLLLVFFAALLRAQQSSVDTAWDLVAKGQRANAIAVLRAAVKTDPTNGDARLLLGSILMEER
jgi:Flp pilus assembly protein TadD